MKRLVHATLIAVVPVLLLVALVLVTTGVLPYRVYIVHTGSMTPTIPSTSAVIVREHDYRVGQVVSFRVNGEVVTHRLVAVNANGTIDTKGDANPTDDPWHPQKSAIIGGVVAAPRFLGYLLVYLRDPAGAGSLLVTILLVWQLWSLARELDTEDRRLHARGRHRVPAGIMDSWT